MKYLLALFLLASTAAADIQMLGVWVDSPSRPGVKAAVWIDSTTPHTFNTWRAKAADRGLRLVSLTTQAEELAWRTYAEQFATPSGVIEFYTGLSRSGPLDAWAWESGDLLNHALPWSAGEPDLVDVYASCISTNGVPEYFGRRNTASKFIAILEAAPFEDCDGDGQHDPVQIFNGEDWDGNGMLDACEEVGAVYCASANVNSTGVIGKARALGSAVVAADDVSLFAFDLPVGELGYWNISMSQGFTPLPMSQGWLCLGLPLIRLDGPPYGIGMIPANGRLRTDLFLNQIPQVGAINAGETWNFQLWHRDGATSNTSEGLSIDFL
ncbi:MAG: C-type lectin domain-containing protein [bacterium]|nr:C-type lectin domain-containing protein [bacterium]